MIKNVEYPVLFPRQEILVKYKKASQWKRAKIIICTNDNFTAFLIDEGITETFNSNSDSILTDLPENYSSFKPAAKRCSLKKLKKENSDEDVECVEENIEWSKETVDYLKKLTSNNQRTFYVNSFKMEKEKIKNQMDELEDQYSIDIFYL